MPRFVISTSEKSLKNDKNYRKNYTISLQSGVTASCINEPAMNEEGHSNMDRIEILEAASTLMSLRRHCDERIRWQRVRSSFYFPHPTMMNPFYGHVWPFYKPYPYDVTSLPMHQHYPFQVSPYMVGPRPWYPAPQPPWLGPMRNTESATPCLPPPMTTLSTTDTSRVQVAMETADDVFDPDDNEDSLGEQDEYTATSVDKYDQKRKRRNLTKRQQEILEKTYHNTKYPHIEDRLELSKATQLTEDRIQIWFQNRRAKDRRMTDVTKSPSMQNQFVPTNELLEENDSAEMLNDEGEVVREPDFDTTLTNSVLEGKDGEPSPKRIKQE